MKNEEYKYEKAYRDWLKNRLDIVCGSLFSALSMQHTTLSMMLTNTNEDLNDLITMSYNYEVANNGLSISEALYRAQ